MCGRLSMWFVILCSCKETCEGKRTLLQPPHWSCLKGVTLSRIGVCKHCRNVTQHLDNRASFSKCQQTWNYTQTCIRMSADKEDRLKWAITLQLHPCEEKYFCSRAFTTLGNKLILWHLLGLLCCIDLWRLQYTVNGKSDVLKSMVCMNHRIIYPNKLYYALY